MTPTELKEWRFRLKMTQLEFCRWIKPKRTPDVISQWELGKKTIPEWLDTLKELTDLKRG